MHQDTINPIQIQESLRRALAEDIGRGDVTTQCIVPPDSWLSGRFVAKESGVVAGITVAEQIFALVNERVVFRPGLTDGSAVATGDVIATITGPGQALLSGERVALNFIQRMSGIATLTRRFVEAVRGSSAVILDTRKTAPGLRWFDKRAVQLGGGQNHRFGLFDMVLIKENHIAAAGSIGEAVRRVRDNDGQKRPIEVEVQTLNELEQTLPLHADRILLDNMSLSDMRRAVQLTRGQTPLEASGNVTLETVAKIAATGVDYISVGTLTHSVRALDISLLLENAEAVVN